MSGGSAPPVREGYFVSFVPKMYRPIVAPPIVINSTLPLGKTRTSTRINKSFLSFPCVS